MQTGSTQRAFLSI